MNLSDLTVLICNCLSGKSGLFTNRKPVDNKLIDLGTCSVISFEALMVRKKYKAVIHFTHYEPSN